MLSETMRISHAPHSRVGIRLAESMKAKPDANTRTLRPDKCLVVSSLSPALRPGFPRNTGANAATTREGLNQFVMLSTLEQTRRASVPTFP